jgi:hypothetical protein
MKANKTAIFKKLRMIDKMQGDNNFEVALNFDAKKNCYILELNTESLLALKRFLQFKDVDEKVKDRTKTSAEMGDDQIDNSKNLEQFSDKLFRLIYNYTKE